MIEIEKPRRTNRHLFFHNPEMREGLSLTVRNGLKWAEARPGSTVDITETPGPADEDWNVECRATIVATQVVNMTDITPDELNALLRFEHAQDCQTLEGLTKVLNKAYGVSPGGPKWGPELTFVWFVV